MKNKEYVNPLLHALLPIFVTIAYILIGFIFDSGWAIGWILFFLIPIIETLVKAIKTKNPSNFAYPVLVTAIFLLTGMLWGLWHPMWVLFITIPAYYAVCDAIKKSKAQQLQNNPNVQYNQSTQQSEYYNYDQNNQFQQSDPYKQSGNNNTAIIISIIVAIAVVAIVAIVCTFSWLSGNFNTPINFGDNESVASYEPGPYNVETKGIKSIDVEWVNGNVDVEYYDGDTIYIEEISSNDKCPMTYYVEGNTLSIDEYVSDYSTAFSGMKDKDLVLKIPKDFVTNEFKIEVVSANINALDLNTFAFELNSVSGKSYISFANQPQQIELDSVSGDIQMVLPSDISGYFINSDSVSGSINTSDFGNELRYGDGKTRIELESVSGNLTLKKG